MAVDSNFLAGVIEGFYGQPWSQAERFQLFRWMKAWRLNTYFYAPKDDLKHRALWREIYTEEEAESLRSLIAQCSAGGLRFIYGIAPGLDIHYSDDWEITVLKNRVEQMQRLGCRDFAILFDDIPDKMKPSDAEKFPSFAHAQCHITNKLLNILPQDSRLLFCPTAYCGRMVAASHGGENYLQTIGKGLSPKIDIFWTGPEIISAEITVAHIQEIRTILRRKPVIWDNLHANDYDGRRFFVGPYSGRPPELQNEVGGILSNPNCEFVLNYIPVRTLGTYLSSTENPREQYLKAINEWASEFVTIRGAANAYYLTLFCDCFYLPHENGPEAEWLLTKVKNDIRRGYDEADVAGLHKFCAELSELKNRALFYALSRRVWELREELDLLQRYMRGDRKSDFHLPGSFRGGFIAELQQILNLGNDGRIFEQ